MFASKQGILQRILGKTGLTTKLENLSADVADLGNIGSDNFLINGGFDFWQRGTSGTCSNTAGGSYVAADRWKISGYSAGVGYSSTDVARDTSPPSGSKYGLKLSSNSAINDAVCALQFIESINCIPLVSKKVTLSSKIKKLAGYNADTPISMSIWYLNSVDSPASEIATTMTNATLIGTYNHTPVGSDWESVSLTVSIPSSGANGLAIRFSYSKSNMGAAEIFSIANVMINIGSQAAPFVRAGRSIGQELALCQRYFEKSAALDVAMRYSENMVATSAGALEIQAYDANWLRVGHIEYKTRKRIASNLVTIYGEYTGNYRRLSEYLNGVIQTSRDPGGAWLSYYSETGFKIWGNGQLASERTYRFHWSCDAEI